MPLLIMQDIFVPVLAIYLTFHKTLDLYGTGVLYTTVNNRLQKRKDPPRGRIQGKDPPRHGGRPRSTKLLTLPDDKEVSSLPRQPKTQFPLDMVSF